MTDPEFQEQIGQQHTQSAYRARDEHLNHGTYFFEQQMLSLIQNGDVVELKRFLLSAAKTPQMREGKLAETPLRQAKNLFIGLVAMIGKYAAIPGGMDIEQTYRLIDIYIQECEKMQSEEGVKSLQYNMPLDFARRVAQQQLPNGVSREVHNCMAYISAHINEPICVDDLAALTGKSRQFLFKHFRAELGTGISAYVMQVRLREAKSLLQYTDKSLGEISSYLCFSSQSHFQNAFKKETGITPAAYRKQHGLRDMGR
ncbi:helix-turn-helix domain-containing protein [Ruminococcus champanellensis]